MRFPAFLVLMGIALPASAQTGLSDPDADTPPPVVTRPVEPVVAGQRQSSDQVSREAGIKPMARVGSRIENRVQSRINNRIDRSYPASAATTAPAVTPGAGGQRRRTGQGVRR